MTQVEGKASQFYTDVKSPVIAGMQFNTKNYKMRRIGYDILRIYFDNADKDCTIGQQRIKRIISI
jgi:hypothetical protein